MMAMTTRPPMTIPTICERQRAGNKNATMDLPLREASLILRLPLYYSCPLRSRRSPDLRYLVDPEQTRLH